MTNGAPIIGVAASFVVQHPPETQSTCPLDR